MLRILLIVVLLLIFFVPVILLAMLPWRLRYKFYQPLYKIICACLNLEVILRGEISPQRPLVFVGNHTSYLDILVLGSVLPASFVSKAEVANWPLVGQMGKFTGTLFIKRDRKLADSHVEQMYDALQNGENLIFFPEGTTGDGVRVLPFKTSLFKLAERHKVTIQPLTVRYSHINGLPVHRNEKLLTSWIGSMSLGPHFKQLMKLGRIRVEVVLHETIAAANPADVDRKILAKQCEQIVDLAL